MLWRIMTRNGEFTLSNGKPAHFQLKQNAEEVVEKYFTLYEPKPEGGCVRLKFAVVTPVLARLIHLLR